jgi:hypothetical protein
MSPLEFSFWKEERKKHDSTCILLKIQNQKIKYSAIHPIGKGQRKEMEQSYSPPVGQGRCKDGEQSYSPPSRPRTL